MDQTLTKSKPFSIPFQKVVRAWELVKANRGSGGVDAVSLEMYQINLERNLYKLWNRLSSGTYFPKPVRLVEIPKKTGGTRPLGIPTVEDRVAQTLVKQEVEAVLDPVFHGDSYGYRPGKSALQAVGKARERCWKYDWVIDLDIKAFFDTIDQGLLMKAVRKHISDKWQLLYLERWLKAPVQLPDGSLQSRSQGTPQGAVVSPVLANLFLHYAMDEWLKRNYPGCPFERYADDALIHCQSEKQAQELKTALQERLKTCGLTLHEEKTRIVYCKDSSRKKSYPLVQFDFLGYTFSPRKIKSKAGNYFTGYGPAVSKKAVKAMREKVKQLTSFQLTQASLADLVRQSNPVVQGWINYYGAFYRSLLKNALQLVNDGIAQWARKKYKRFNGSKWKALQWLKAMAKRSPDLFAHWQIGSLPQGGS